MLWLSILRLKALTWFGGPLAALISLATLQNALNTFGYPAVVIFVMIESSGIPFPGETMLLLAAFYAGATHQLQIPIVIACAALGAIIGDNIGYLIGRTGGRAIVVRFGKYVFIKPEHLDRAELYFANHGDKTVFFGRFIAVLRAWAAFLAGVNHMHWRTFLFYNAAGGILWAATFGTLGYVAGRYLQDNFAQVERIAGIIGWLGAGLIVAAALAVFIVYRVRKNRHVKSLAKAKTIEQEQEEELKTGP
jgi:membrane protein DedA with SNARE-associated domain